MTAVGAERIVRAGVTGMQGLDSLVSGMTVTNLGPGRNKILLRGISDGVFTGLTQSTVGLYLDLTPVTYAAPDPDLKLIDIDRVEVLRSPQGTLYGTGPIGGVVHIVTRAPAMGEESLSLSATRSRTDGGGWNSDYGLVANLPVAGDRAAIRAALDQAGYAHVAILAYSAKYASAYFGPFREAVGSTLKGDRRTYQQDPANRREGLFEALLDAAEGADMLMVKPAGPYLDVLADVAAASDIPVAAYQVSGEYAMVEAAAANGWIDRTRVIDESLTGIFRAGADSVLTYWALEVARRAR